MLCPVSVRNSPPHSNIEMFSAIKSKIQDINLVPPKDGQANASTKEGYGHNNHGTDGNDMPPALQPTLLITSYDRFTLPHPRPDLEYDCRETPNPSKNIRSINTGVDDSLQSQLLQRDEFSNMLSRAEEEVRRLMEERKKLVEREARDNVSMTVRVGCLCGSGHHRSVAFAECLRKRDWPGDWKVEVEHRDLTDEVVERKREKKRDSIDAL